MGTPGLPSATQPPGSVAGITSEIETRRSVRVVFRNSHIAIATILAISVSAAVISVCMVLFVFSIFSSGFSLSNIFSALVWLLGAFSIGYMCPWLWKLARSMATKRVTLDRRGIDFSLGTKKKPEQLFLAWEQVAAIRHQRADSAHWYWVQCNDGSEVRFSSYTFFRPKKVARLIADRTGLSIQEA